MNTIAKNIILVVAGLLFALLLLFIYSQFITQGRDNPEYFPLNREGVFVAALSGEVYILRENETIKAQLGQSLLEGDVLKVVDQSFCQIQFAQRGTATLNSNTLLRLQRFFNADKDMDIATEILMGSMLYRVNKTEDNQRFLIESEGAIYEITGTDFLITRSLDGTRLSVTEGSVLVRSNHDLWNPTYTESSEELFIPTGASEPQQFNSHSSGQSKLMEDLLEISEIYIKPEQPDPVMIQLETIPQGANIYLNGRKIGTSSFQGLFDPNLRLNFRVRKRGYADGLLVVETEGETNRLYRVELSPLRLQDSLRQQEEFPIQEDPTEEIRLEYQGQLEQREEQLQRIELERQDLQEEIQQSQNRNDNLQQQLSSSTQEISRLKELILQIQQLADQ
ncbi:MAG: FecR domain-containing protein [Spirochaetaceae bacterium]|jgi:hypothetical protein|nr:FecR domain-containing protein [Spirochaetaceae bacterium]